VQEQNLRGVGLLPIVFVFYYYFDTHDNIFEKNNINMFCKLDIIKCLSN
jgi:hypothetical protein